MSVEKAPFGKLTDGREVDLYTLTNENAMCVRITNFGGIVVSIEVPDRDGKMADVALGFDSIEGYENTHPYFGALVGRCGNRIAKAKFTLDGKTYTLAANNDVNHLHGGLKGFDKAVWAAEPIEEANAVGLKLQYTSVDGEEGYPGTLKCTVEYRLTNENELKIEYFAETDKPTPVNLTNHSYFNLKGQGEGTILDHVVYLNAKRFTPIDETFIPTGELRAVAGTPMDFTTPTAIGARIHADDEQLKNGKGYDHNFVLDGDGLSLVARVEEKTTGRVLEAYTMEPGVQFYVGNFLDGTLTGKDGKVYEQRYGFCLETQHFPDSPNHPDFPSIILKPGEQYHTETVYKFSAE